jgi:hypothetical protein
MTNTTSALVLEGPDIRELLQRVRAEHGERATIVRAERVRSGGVAGFFAKERYEVAIALDEQDHSGSTGVEALLERAGAGDSVDVRAHDAPARDVPARDVPASDVPARDVPASEVSRQDVRRHGPLSRGTELTDLATLLRTTAGPEPTVSGPQPPALKAPDGAGQVLVLIGDGARVLAAAEQMAVRRRIPRSRVLLASPDPLVPGLTTHRRIEDAPAARLRTAALVTLGTASIVVVDAPMTCIDDDDLCAWVAAITRGLMPTAVWAVVDATRRPEVNSRWTSRLASRLDTLDAICGVDTHLVPESALGDLALDVRLPVACL